MRTFFCALSIVGTAFAANDGLALKPPMGWRSWNCFGAEVTQPLMQGIMDRMAERTRYVNGKLTSLADLGYNDCGLDDNWQQCGAGVYGSFTAANGDPVINLNRFPNQRAMTTYGHDRGLTVGWYMNNCICSEHQFKTAQEIQTHMEGSIKAVVNYGYDGLKLDGCGQFRNLTWFYQLIRASGRKVVVENCHWGETVPGQMNGDGPCTGTTAISDCPYHFFRSSGDIENNWASMFSNLQTTRKFQGAVPLSRPGGWAYPDMMEVGRMPSYDQDRSHFGAWVITSSPLILGYNLNDQAITDKVWDILSNTEAIAINQNWNGHPGRLVREWNPGNSTPTGDRYAVAIACTGAANQRGWTVGLSDQKIKTRNGLMFASTIKGPGGLCLDATYANQIRLVPCTGSAAQQWTVNAADKTIRQGGRCLDVWNNQGPVVELWDCNGGGNQRFDFNADTTLSDNDNPKHCLTSADAPPNSANVFQLWAKPQPNGAVAAFVVSSTSNGAHSANVTFAELGLPNRVSVRNIWQHKDVGVFTTQYTTDNLVPYDSVLLLLSPA